MSKSSRLQLELDILEPQQAAEANSSSEAEGAEFSPSRGTESEIARIASRGGNNEAFAATSRIAGRINAASISDDEFQALLAERQHLLDKKLSGTMSRRDSNRLKYVRWSLDRIEDARNGWILDTLENTVARYENFLLQVGNLQQQLEDYAQKRK